MTSSTRRKPISITCSPKSAAGETKLDAFYEELKEVIHSEKFLYKYLVGDFNSTNLESGERSENSNRLAGLLFAARLFYRSSNFMKKEHGRCTRESSNGTSHAELDHILTNRRCTVCRDSTIILQWIDREDLCNYRPISPLNMLCKKVIVARISKTLGEAKPKVQAGFSKGFICMGRIHTIENLWGLLVLVPTFVNYEKA